MSAAGDSSHPRRGARSRRLTIVVTGAGDALAADVRAAARRTLRSGGIERGHLEIAVIADAQMRRQHRRWLGDPSSTDVLTFDLRDRRSPRTVDGLLLVCGSLARTRARRRGGDWRAELILYVVHGCLHLCGYNDRDSREARHMHELEDQILSRLGWGRVFAGARRPGTGAGRARRRRRGGSR